MLPVASSSRPEDRAVTEAPDQREPDEHEPPPATVRVIDARTIFERDREVVIELDGVRYRLRITRRNRLILQK
jgi:hemin uptake protein HemP